MIDMPPLRNYEYPLALPYALAQGRTPEREHLQFVVHGNRMRRLYLLVLELLVGIVLVAVAAVVALLDSLPLLLLASSLCVQFLVSVL